jgi:tripeptide aminopeptidase
MGGHAKNIVCESVLVEGEARSHNPDMLESQIAIMRECFAAACEKHKARVDFSFTMEYESFSLSPDEPIIKLLLCAAKARGYDLSLVATGGGSDANVLNSIGIPAANLPVGMHNAHSASEYTDLRETAETIELMVELFRCLSDC